MVKETSGRRSLVTGHSALVLALALVGLLIGCQRGFWPRSDPDVPPIPAPAQPAPPPMLTATPISGQPVAGLQRLLQTAPDLYELAQAEAAGHLQQSAWTH